LVTPTYISCILGGALCFLFNKTLLTYQAKKKKSIIKN